MRDIYEDTGMSNVYLEPDEILALQITDTKSFRARVPDILGSFIECTTFANHYHLETVGHAGIVFIFLP
jgi:hypothetical protein